MACESRQRTIASSNRGGLKSEPKKIRPKPERISFRDLAKLAARRKTIQFLCDRVSCDPSTAKRWLSRASRVPDRAIYVVLADIFARIE